MTSRRVPDAWDDNQKPELTGADAWDDNQKAEMTRKKLSKDGAVVASRDKTGAHVYRAGGFQGCNFVWSQHQLEGNL